MRNLRLLSILGVLLGVLGCAGGRRLDITNEDVSKLAGQTAEANAALIRGDIDHYISLTNHAKDYTLMPPYGGKVVHGFDPTPERRAEMAKFFRSGTFKQEVVATYTSNDLVVLVTIERIRAVIDGLPEQDWSLRVTQIFRRQGKEWLLLHRHADPLLSRISLEQMAVLARGDKS
jgi:ketosteroid isomerase-like protein